MILPRAFKSQDRPYGRYGEGGRREGRRREEALLKDEAETTSSSWLHGK
jgi:hypothetical protein